MSKKKLAKKIIIPIILIALVASAITVFAVTKKKSKETPPIVSIVTNEERDIEFEIQNAVANHNICKEYNGNYNYKSITDVSFANEISDKDKALTFKYITGSPDENAFRLYLNKKKLAEQKDEFISLIEGQYTKTNAGLKSGEGFYYGNLDKSYIYVENPEGTIEMEDGKYSIELEISQTAYWLDKTVIPSPTTLYVREKYIYDELSSNFMYLTYVYEMVNIQ